MGWDMCIRDSLTSPHLTSHHLSSHQLTSLHLTSPVPPSPQRTTLPGQRNLALKLWDLSGASLAGGAGTTVLLVVYTTKRVQPLLNLFMVKCFIGSLKTSLLNQVVQIF